jgi:hypothetical protein
MMTLLDAENMVGSDNVRYADRPSELLLRIANNSKTPPEKAQAARLILAARANPTAIPPMPADDAPTTLPAHDDWQTFDQPAAPAQRPAPVAKPQAVTPPAQAPAQRAPAKGFRKAEKSSARAHVALCGPSGSGKTYSALVAATTLGGKIAVIDTERGSASLYADRFNFDVLELETFSPQAYIDAIELAEREGYAVIVIDSLSHAWEGEGGALEMVDAAAARSKSNNTYFAWRDVTPLQRKMVDAMLQSKAHIIATMRAKTEYIIDTDQRGKQVPRKVGMAPIQRAGIEYEFTLTADIDVDHRLVVTKSRCDAMADKVTVKPSAQFWQVFVDWLK